MKKQRWHGDYQTIPQEFASAKAEEQMGLSAVNNSMENDYLAGSREGLDRYQTGELEPSWSTQLDTVGMQPHAREYLDRQMNCMRSDRQYEIIGGQMIDYTDGIHFGDTP